MLRVARVWLNGIETLKDDPNPLLAARSRRLRDSVRSILPVAAAAIAFSPSDQARERARQRS